MAKKPKREPKIQVVKDDEVIRLIADSPGFVDSLERGVKDVLAGRVRPMPKGMRPKPKR